MISKNNSEQLFGVVKERDIKIDYEGSESSTVVVSVDAENKIISAEVKLQGILGTTDKKAYPGNLGAIAYDNALETKAKLNESVQDLKQADKNIISDINAVKRDYADKVYVKEQIIASTTLSKQIVDGVDLVSNKIIVNGVYESPVDGILYLVKQLDSLEETNYKQYTTVQGNLTMIGTTSVDLTDYATLEYVDDSVDVLEYSLQSLETDLINNYATKSSIPDVSRFITEIPSDYTTEDEVTDYVTDRLSDYATKSYVQYQLSKAGSFTKLIVDSVNTDNNTYVKDGITSIVVQDVLYLVPVTEEGSAETVYHQYTVIDQHLEFIGTTKMDLEGYATVTYVDQLIAASDIRTNKKILDLKSELTSLLTNISFIDGGTSSTL